jgi:hypothetical protein
MKKIFILIILFSNYCFSQTVHYEAENYSLMSGIGVYPCTEGGQCVGSIDNGDWIQYNVPSGNYLISMRIASINNGAKVQVGNRVIQIPNTGNWQGWKTITDTVTSTGVLKFISTGAGWNFNWFELSPIVNNPPPPIIDTTFNNKVYSLLNLIDSITTNTINGKGKFSLWIKGRVFNLNYTVQ